MMNEDAVAGLESGSTSGFLDYTDWLVTQYRSGLAPDVPGHDVAGTNSACASAHQDIAGAHLGSGGFFDADVTKIVKTCDLHSPS